MKSPQIQILSDPKAIAQEAGHRIVAAAQAKLADGSQFFSLVLSGGSTPKILYEMLAGEPYRSKLNWEKVEIYFGDERCVPPDHPDSNYLMAKTAMLSKLPIPEANIHRMRGEMNPEIAAGEYGKLLKSKFGDGGADLVLLGMGPDGHTASLFPGTAALNETHHRCVANFVPQMKTWRITMSYSFLNKAANVLILVAGADKAARLKEVLQGPADPQRLPIQGISPIGQCTWLLDTAAAANWRNDNGHFVAIFSEKDGAGFDSVAWQNRVG